ncbi:hypothetical protein B0H66DRAFT_530800 [Apodospora peruviana]|uniref:Uncharacterized protein n=1 Tax=Apodospora peruviana TaxID=516989 RepID=A0AAE0MC60_9PEZI|nr:hypothetical protein B0H66DRAFT_530800 [Apodospora peruviana]
MVSTAFGFGENDTYLIQCPSRRCYHNLPSGLVTLLEQGDVAEVLNVAFGPGGSYAMAFREPCSRGYRLQTDRLPADLESWLFKTGWFGNYKRSFSTMQISLGPKTGRFFASDGKSSLWDELPPKLEQKFASMRQNGGTGGWISKQPTLVSFGSGDDFVLLAKAEDETEIFWELKGYPELAKALQTILDNDRLADLKNLSLSPFKKDTFALLIDDIFVQNGVLAKFLPAFEKFGEDVKLDAAAARPARQEEMQPEASSSQRMSAVDVPVMSTSDSLKLHHASLLSTQDYIFDGLAKKRCQHCMKPEGVCVCPLPYYLTDFIR